VIRKLTRLGKLNGGQSKGKWKIDGLYMLVAPYMVNTEVYDDPVKVLTWANCYRNKLMLSYQKGLSGN
jgi:hypothetical protein